MASGKKLKSFLVIGLLSVEIQNRSIPVYSDGSISATTANSASADNIAGSNNCSKKTGPFSQYLLANLFQKDSDL